MAISNKKLLEIIDFYNKHGNELTTHTYNLSAESLSRYLRKVKTLELGEVDKNSLLRTISEQYSDRELEAIAKGGRLIPGMGKVPIIDFDGERIRFTVMADPHIGSLFTDDDHIYKCFEESLKQKSEFILVPGDVTEGMSNRPGHIYELRDLGYDKQKEHAVNILGEWDKPMYMISGNHDRWFIKSNGADIVKDICTELNNQNAEQRYFFLGHDEGDLSLKGMSTLKMWHGEDASSYAISYRIQKVVESLTGGTKPGIMIFAHVHKFIYLFIRHIHCAGGGSIQRQTKWMRGKRIDAHVGFEIIDVWVNKHGIGHSQIAWYPYYC